MKKKKKKKKKITWTEQIHTWKQSTDRKTQTCSLTRGKRTLRKCRCHLMGPTEVTWPPVHRGDLQRGQRQKDRPDDMQTEDALETSDHQPSTQTTQTDFFVFSLFQSKNLSHFLFESSTFMWINWREQKSFHCCSTSKFFTETHWRLCLVCRF